MTKNNEKNGLTMKVLCVALIAGVIIFIVWVLTYKKEEYRTTEIANGDYTTLKCDSTSPDSPFFVSQNVQRFTHEIKTLFVGERIKEMSYRYDGVYNSDETAEHAMAVLQKNYYEYMESFSLSPESLNPVFSVNKSKSTISLYAEAKKLNAAVARLFFVQGEDFDVFNSDKNSPESLKKVYESKGFTCNFYE